MPSTEAPTYYERCSGVCPSITDPFFQAISLGEAIEDTGDVESPVGFVALVKVDEDLIQWYRESVNVWATEDDELPDEGWYVVRKDDNGLVWAMDYGEDCTFNEEKARADFAEAVNTYERWTAEVES